MPSTLVEALKEVSKADLATHPPFAFATIAVLSNYERQHLNRKQAEAFARAHGLPLVLWKHRLCGQAAELLDAAAVDEMYTHEPGLWGAFVRGAPAMLTQNIQPSNFLVNWACGFMHSLSFENGPPQELADTLATPGFCLVHLDEPPLCVNFQVTLPDADDGAGIESLVPEAVVVPVVTSKHTEVHDTTSLWACIKGVPKHLRGHRLQAPRQNLGGTHLQYRTEAFPSAPRFERLLRGCFESSNTQPITSVATTSSQQRWSRLPV